MLRILSGQGLINAKSHYLNIGYESVGNKVKGCLFALFPTKESREYLDLICSIR